MPTSVSLVAHSFPWAVLSIIPRWLLERAIAQLAAFTITTLGQSALIRLPPGNLYSQWMTTVRPESSVGLSGPLIKLPCCLYSPAQFHTEGWQYSSIRLTHERYLPSLARLLTCRLRDCFTLLLPVLCSPFAQMLCEGESSLRVAA